MQKIIFLLSALLIVGCSNQAELTALAEQDEWQKVGVTDGESGHYQRGEIELTKLSSLDEDAYHNYKMGYLTGIEQYCQPEKSYQHGLDGRLYRGQCANTVNESQSIQQWSEGYNAYLIDSAFITYGDD